MVKNKKVLEKFEKELVRRSKPDYKKNFEIFEQLLKNAKRLGAFPPKDPLEGIEVDIKIAKILNSVK